MKTVSTKVKYRTAARSNRKVVVALDMDNTTVDFTAGLRAYLRQMEGLSADAALRKYPEPTNYDYFKGDKPWFADVNGFLSAFKAAEKQGLYRKLRARPGAKAVIAKLLRDPRVELHVVTARSNEFEADTRVSMKALGLSAMPLEHLENKVDYPAHIFVDDKDSFATAIRTGNYSNDGITKTVILPPTGYNRHLNPAKNWNDLGIQLDREIARVYAQLNKGSKIYTM